ncbi:metal ABC transporter permease [Marinobacter sp. 2_MG-2023]|uniref:metal ABC transporter permease n=1 Tax=Marinobacter sp. 2_MG-2023 TaxID=3062679 RepID=UPI0026E233A7|nr:metal ABC transporter permease [Marinobacter sp. 2_MG-2023]MDO6441721.1 metal ABC transporter permease [Marinobacter sp. 2_MG-2023]
MAAYEWMLLPTLGSVLLCFLLVPLGYQVIARGVIFADLAIAQWASLGTLAGATGTYFVLSQDLAGASVTSLAFALLAALTVQLILRHLGEAKEAGIGILYVLGASLAVLLVSNDPHGAQVLQRAASGDLLWANQELVIATAVMALLVWALGYWAPGWLSGAAFIPVFAIAVTYAVALAGIYVVFATLIITPLIVGTLHKKTPVVASLCAIVGHLLAIACSVIWDVPVGPAIVVATLLVACLWPVVSGNRRYTQ